MTNQAVKGCAVLDHLVVAAATLEQGADYIQGLLGVDAQAGGRHLNQGTHNRLLSLGPDRYLEIIAIDPAGKTPVGRRWFGLDDPELQREIVSRPRLLTWVARCDDIDKRIADAAGGSLDVRPMQRGEVRWRMSFTADGSLQEHGLVPPLIQWQSEPHPASRLPDVGCRLVALCAVHPDPGRVKAVLARLGLDDQIQVRVAGPGQSPGLSAEIQMPAGGRIIDGV